MNESHLYQGLLTGWVALAGLVFLLLLFVSAPYGRHRRGGWGPTVPATAGWMLMESPAVVVFALLFALGRGEASAASWAFLLLWQAHYLHRAFVYPLRCRRSADRMPVAIAAMAFAFNVTNAYLNARYLFTLGPEREASWLADPRFLAGAALFVAGMGLNFDSDRRLRALRRPGESAYRVPRGGLFRLVSCPNYLGEIIGWCGWALATWSPAGLAFALWTAANLVPRALAHHGWYRERFPDYPAERKALVPFVL